MSHSLCSRMEARLGALSRETDPAPTPDEIASLMEWAREYAPQAARMEEEFPDPSTAAEEWVETASAADLERAIAVFDMLVWARRRRFVEDYPERAMLLMASDFIRPRALATLAFPVPPPAFALA